MTDFLWIKPGLFAAGKVPAGDEYMGRLSRQGFTALLALGEPSQNAKERILKYGLDICLCGVHPKTEAAVDDTVMTFPGSHFFRRQPVYVCSSHGVKMAVRTVNLFLEKRDLYTAKFLRRRANDLNHGDQFDWIRGHQAFEGALIDDAVNFPVAAPANPHEETQLTAADAITELADHADHGCFTVSAVKTIQNVLQDVQNIVLKNNPGYRADYEDRF